MIYPAMGIYLDNNFEASAQYQSANLRLNSGNAQFLRAHRYRTASRRITAHSDHNNDAHSAVRQFIIDLSSSLYQI